jgi:hypothetical protein
VDVYDRKQTLAVLKAVIFKECGRGIYPDPLILAGMALAGGWKDAGMIPVLVAGAPLATPSVPAPKKPGLFDRLFPKK